MISKFTRRILIVSSLVVITILLGIAIGQNKEKNETLKSIDLFGETVYYVKTRYVEAVDNEKLFTGALHGLAENLDPESFYLEPKHYSEFLENDKKLPQDQLGLRLVKQNRYIRILTTEPGSPADKAGLRSGDYITHVEGIAGYDLSLYQTANLLHGKIGSEVKIEILELRTGLERNIKLKRQNIRFVKPVVDTFYNGKIKYLSISHFYLEEVAAIKKEIENQKLPLLIDLRQNHLGNEEGLREALDMFNKEGDLLYHEMKKKKIKKTYKATAELLTPDKPIYLLVDNSTTHFAEIFAKTMMDLKAATTYGKPTKGLIGKQEAIQIKDGGAVFITTTIYLTPLEENIYMKGFKPDIEIEMDDIDYKIQPEIVSDNKLIKKKDPLLNEVLIKLTEKAVD